MKIIVVGDGKVGFAIAKQLNQEGHDITVVENKANVLSSTMNQLDIVGVQGNGASLDTLLEARVPSSDLLIAATSTDEVNIICCLLAKKLGARYTIARIRNPEYNNTVRLIKDELGLSMSINPEQAAAREILRAIRFSNSIKVSSFAKGRIELAEVKVTENSPLINMRVVDINRRFKTEVLFVTILRDGEVIIPNGNTVIYENDRLTLTGSTTQLERFFIKIGILSDRTVNEVMIVGGGRITYYLTSMLLELGMAVKIIELNKEKCINLVEKFPQATVIHGDGTDHELLLSESLEEMDAFIALTDNDEENVIISMFAQSHGVTHVLPKVNRVSLGFLLEKLGLENSITPKFITANQIVQYVRAMQNTVGSNVESLIKLVDDKVEALEFRVRDNCRFIDVPIKDLNIRKGIIIAYVTHKGVSKVATGDMRIQLSDTVIIISKVAGLRDINDLLS